MFHRPPRTEDNIHNIICGKGIKVLLKIKLWGLAHQSSLVSPCQLFSLSLSLSLSFFRLIPWSIEALCIHLSAWASKTWMGRRSASSLPWETGRVPAAYMNRARPLSWGFTGFLCKPRNISFYSFLSHSFIHSPMPFLLRVPLDPAGAGPWQKMNILKY